MTGWRRAVGLLLVALVGCGGQPTAEVPVATRACEAPEFPPLQFGSHLLGDSDPPVPYSSDPPTSGWHASGATPIRVHEPPEALSAPQQVSVLESGAVVVTHHDLPAEETAALLEAVRSRYDGRVAVTPYDGAAPDRVVLAGWGVMQRCDDLDLDALDAFVAAYADEQPFVPGTDDSPRVDGPAGDGR